MFPYVVRMTLYTNLLYLSIYELFQFIITIYSHSSHYVIFHFIALEESVAYNEIRILWTAMSQEEGWYPIYKIPQ